MKELDLVIYLLEEPADEHLVTRKELIRVTKTIVNLSSCFRLIGLHVPLEKRKEILDLFI